MSEQEKENLTPESPAEEKAEGEAPTESAEKAENEAPKEEAPAEQAETEAPKEEAPAEKAETEAPKEEAPAEKAESAENAENEAPKEPKEEVAAAASTTTDETPAEGAPPSEPAPAGESTPATDASTAETAETAEAPEGAAAPTPAPEPKPVSYEPEGAGPFYATGRRKTAIARVYLTQGSGQITVNGRAIEQFFVSELWRRRALEPLSKFGLMEKFDAKVSVQGGGSTGQSGAIQLGIARALLIAIPEIKRDLRTSGFLTRDARIRERKKYGQKGARRRFQWTKR